MGSPGCLKETGPNLEIFQEPCAIFVSEIFQDKIWHSCRGHIEYFYVINRGLRHRWTGLNFFWGTWCKAVRPSTFAVLMSAPFSSSLSTSSLSPAAHAAKNTQPDENLTLRDLCFGDTGSRFVSDSSHLFSCSALLNRAEFDRVSRDMFTVSIRFLESTVRHHYDFYKRNDFFLHLTVRGCGLLK